MKCSTCEKILTLLKNKKSTKESKKPENPRYKLYEMSRNRTQCLFYGLLKNCIATYNSYYNSDGFKNSTFWIIDSEGEIVPIIEKNKPIIEGNK